MVSTFIGMAVIGAFRAYGTVLADFLAAVVERIKFE
ncbi:hypothetical protein [Methylobacterium sp. AMS5]|nr:hypothetical protein [Methylobacterium sp. AMS5]